MGVIDIGKQPKDVPFLEWRKFQLFVGEYNRKYRQNDFYQYFRRIVVKGKTIGIRRKNVSNKRFRMCGRKVVPIYSR